MAIVTEQTEQQIKLDHELARSTAESNRMFDTAEKIIMSYMCEHLAKTPQELFVDPSPMLSPDKPLILNPILSYSDKYLAFNLEIVEANYVSNIPEALMEDESINYTIGFIYHSITTVFNAIISKNIAESAKELIIQSSFHLEMDDNKLTLFPLYIFPKRRGQLMLLQMKDELEKTLEKYKDTSDTEQPGIDRLRLQCKNANDHLATIQYDNEVANSTEKNMNELLVNKCRIGINVVELTKEQLPNNLTSTT